MSTKRLLLALGVCVTIIGSSYAQPSDTTNIEVPVQKKDYRFKVRELPRGFSATDFVVFPYGQNIVYTLRGNGIIKYGDEIIDLAISPAAINGAVLTRMKKKKKNEVTIYDITAIDKPLLTLNNKQYGQPTAIAYTPDARRFLLATDKGLKILDGRTFAPLGEFQLPFVPTKIVVSPNNNFMAISDGKNVALFNFEEKRIRKRWDFEDTVTALDFSKDNSQFAIVTSDGLITIYDTVNFLVKKTLDDMGDGIDGKFNFDGKYMAVAKTPELVEVINILDTDDKETVPVDSGNLNTVKFITDYLNKTLLVYTTKDAINAKRMDRLEPYYGKLIADEVNELMNEWLKMMPGETMDEYLARISDENRTKQMRLFEEQVSAKYAGDLLSMSTISLGKYDRNSGLLELGLGNMPNIYLPVPENEVPAFINTDYIEFHDPKYGIMPDDNFELIYADVHNRANNKHYIYDNLDRKPLDFLSSEADLVSIEILQQQQMEELRLQELRERVVEEAKKQNVITDHTQITVDSRIVPDFNADGEKILNYQVNFSYEVEPDFSVSEDFAPGKYEVSESGAASSMLSIVKQAFEGDLAQYLVPGKKIRVKVYGNADGMPISRKIPYSGIYGDIENELVYQNGQLTGISVDKKGGITTNEQLAFLRARGVTDYLDKNVETLRNMNSDYQYYIEVLEDKGGEFRRITAEFTIIDVF